MTGFLQKAKDFFRNIIEFIKDTRKELKNVSWPNRRELISTTIVVIVSVFFFGAFLFVVDQTVSRVVMRVLNMLSS